MSLPRLLLLFVFLNTTWCVEPTTHVFAKRDSGPLSLDLYVPVTQRGPLIVNVHGGAWRSGSRANPPCLALVDAGYAVASVDYRLSPVAPFPAQAFDIRAAIRFLRAQQEALKIKANHIVLFGCSAGGHLAAVVGVSNGVTELDHAPGDDAQTSAAVQGIVSYYGASNLTTILAQSTPFGLSVREPALKLFLGGLPNEKPALAQLASPCTHVDANDPPLLMLHGEQDPQMPINQSLEFASAYRLVGARVQFMSVPKAAHGGPLFFDAERLPILLAFLAALEK